MGKNITYNSDYKRRRQPTCSLCLNKIKVCNAAGPHRRNGGRRNRHKQILVEHPVQTWKCPRITARFPYCQFYYVDTHVYDIDILVYKMLEDLLVEAEMRWNVPWARPYQLDVGVGVGEASQPEDLIWTEGLVYICRHPPELTDVSREEQVKQLKIVCNNVLDGYDSPIINTVCIEKKDTYV